MYKILIPEDIADSGKEYLLERGYELKVGVSTDTETLKRELMDADGVIVRNARYPREVFEGSKRLKVIGRHGTGVDNIDVKAAQELGIYVVNGPIANINAVAEHTVAVILALSCGLKVADKRTCGRDWTWRLSMKRHEIKGSKVGIIGYGHIGQLVAEKLVNGLGAQIIAYDTRRTDRTQEHVEISDDLEYVLAHSDYVSLHIPSTPDTRDMFNYEMFKKMKKGSFFVNCARGDLYIEDDLVKVIKEGHLAGAALDVYREEPLKDSELYDMDEVILTQHEAGLSEESKVNMSLYAAMGVDQVLSGKEPTWAVNHPHRG